VRNDLSLEEKTEGGLTEAVYELKMSGDWGESANPTTQAIATVSALAEDGDSAMGEALNEKRSSNIFQWARAALDLALSQWLLLSMGLVIALAYRFPSVGKSGGYIASQWTVTYGAVSLIFLVSGLSLSFDQLVKHTRNVRLHLIVQVMSFLVTSSVSSASPALLVQTSISTSPRSSA
jgi:hypothetical protein